MSSSKEVELEVCVALKLTCRLLAGLLVTYLPRSNADDAPDESDIPGESDSQTQKHLLTTVSSPAHRHLHGILVYFLPNRTLQLRTDVWMFSSWTHRDL